MRTTTFAIAATPRSINDLERQGSHGGTVPGAEDKHEAAEEIRPRADQRSTQRPRRRKIHPSHSRGDEEIRRAISTVFVVAGPRINPGP